MQDALKKMVRPWLPLSIRRALRDALDRLLIGCDRILGRHPDLTPSHDLITGIGGAWGIGEQYLRYFRELCDLRPEESVLDVGCGVGRMAIPLAGYLSKAGSYEGFDIMRANVRWCRRAITPRWPNFRFQHADVFNREYNPEGRLKGDHFPFPYPDSSFDFAFLTSVFTHLMPPDAVHYLAELGRVLKPQGRCLATFNLLTDEAERLIEAGKCKHVLQPREGAMRVHSREVPEACIALDEAMVVAAALQAGLSVEKILYGAWCGRDQFFEFQDVVIFRKR